MNILIISPYFAPCTLVGALRMTSLAKHLAQCGHSISVIKIKDEEYPLDCIDPKTNQSVATYLFSAEGKDFQIEKNLQELIDEVCMQKFDCCIVSCGPYYTIRPSLYLTKKYGIPLVVDYRDLWLYDPRPAQTLRSFLGIQKRRILNKAIEKELMKQCAGFVTVTPASVHIMEKHYPILKGKTKCIYNGYVPSLDIDSFVSNERRTESVDICFLGKLSYYDRSAALMYFQSVAELRNQGYPVRIVHIGIPEDNLTLLEEVGLPSDAYVQLGQMPYQKAMQTAKNADIFASIINCQYGLGTKLFDYIYLNRPIVAVAPPKSEFEELLKTTTAGYVCQTKEQIETSIKNIIDQKQTYLTEDTSFSEAFSRQQQNQRYLELLLSLHNKHG